MKIQPEDVSQEELTQAPKKKVKKVKEPRDIRYMFRKALSAINLPNLKKPWMAQKAFKLINTPEDLQAWVDSVLSDTSRHLEIGGELTPVIALDTETMGLDTRILVDRVLKDDGSWELTYEVNIELAGICLSSDGMDGIYVPVNHEKKDQELLIPATNIDREKCAEILQKLFDRSHLVFYNAKFDREVLRITMGIDFRPYPHFEDVQVIAYINDPKADLGDKGKFTGEAGGLKALSKNVLGIEQIELEEIAKIKADYCPITGGPFCHCDAAQRKENKHTLKNVYAPFGWVPTDIALWYAAGDAICTWLLWKKMHELARSRKLIHRIDHELVESITWVERQRWLVDTDRLGRTVKGHGKKIIELRKNLRRIALEAGYEETKQDDGIVLEDDQFNPGSTMQLQTLLFKVKGYTVTKFTTTGNPSCDAEALEDLHKEHPDDEFLNAILQYRDYMALHPDNLRYDERDHSARIYLKQNVVAGGRLAAAGGDFERDGGFGLNPQGIKKIESYLMWKINGNILTPDPDEISDEDIEEHTEEELHPSCFKEKEEDVVVGYKDEEGELPLPTVITLSSEERTLANRLGALRNDKSESDGRRADWYDTRGGGTLENHQDGVACEMCHARMLGYPLDDYESCYFTIDTFKKADFGEDVEVRGTKMSAWAGKVKDNDVDSRVVVFYRKVNDQSFKLLGWLTVKEGKQVGFYDDPGNRSKPAYFIKDSQLHPIDTLPKECGTPQVKVERSATSIPIIEKRKVKKKAPGIIKNHIGKYMGYAVCLVPGCTTCADKYGILIEKAKIDANEVINLRCLFCAPPGWTLFCCDYSNIEMRCAANVSGEPEFIKEFLDGDGDFHALTASKVFPGYSDPTSPDYRAKHLRDLAKIINFALLYGGTAFTIFENMRKKDPNITFDDAQKMVSKYWDGVPIFSEFCNMKQDIAKNEMLCKTATGRVISFKSAMEAQHIHPPTEEDTSNYWSYRDLMKKSEAAKKNEEPEKAATYRAMADRMWKNPDTGVRNCMDYNKFMGKIQRVSVNVPLQGLAGDFMRMALNRVRKWAESEPLIQSVFHLNCTVHDEIDFIVKNEYVPFILPRITRLMKLRKLHEKMGWPVPIESDAEYGQSWDVEHHVTGDADHVPAAWTEIKGMETYIPDEWDVDTLKNLIHAISSGVEARIDKAREFLRESLHERAFIAAKYCFVSIKKEKGKKIEIPQTDPAVIKKHLIAALQLDEFWRIDNTPDDKDDMMETFLTYEQRNELGPDYRDPRTPPEGYLSPIPLHGNVKRPTIEILGEAVLPEEVEVLVSDEAITVSVDDEDNEDNYDEGEVSEPEPPKAMAAAAGVSASTASVVTAVVEAKPVAEPEPVVVAEPPVEEGVFAETPVIRKKVVERIPGSTVLPDDGQPTYELIDLDDTACARLRALLGSGNNTIRILYRGKIAFLRNKNLNSVPEEYVRMVHGISKVLKP